MDEHYGLDDFTNLLRRWTGETIDTETFNFANGIFWHIVWTGLGIF
ncbi:MAG: methane monooxygenase/ammonia monooxygenase subunit B [Nitrosomonas sp.]|nr:methane monooxygenase/ammonia monooxygenase subunit B [Nitrosomonas sp.]